MTMNVTFYRDVANRAEVAKDMMAFDNAIVITSSAQSDATPDGASFVKVVCTEAAYVAYGETVGASPTASAGNGDYAPAGIPLFYTAVAGAKVAGIAV